MANPTTEAIKEKLNIVDFIRGYLEVTPAGKNFKARCPFHNEKTPSFMISPDRQSWHCFGCGVGGDVFGFLMKYENMEFGEALRVLAEKAGVELKRLNPQEYKLTGLLYELNEKAKDFWQESLRGYEPAKSYLAERGLEQETIDEFELGWASNDFEALSMRLLGARYSPDDILRAGLAVKNDRGLLTDRFRGRIMFPIHNHVGKIVGFTGRLLPRFEKEGIGKYVNSPETAVFQKSKILYGFWASKNHVRETGSVFLVEGQMDFLMSWQAGIKNAVATSGTALTLDHLRSIRRVAEEIVLSFDNDTAGSAAAERAIDLAESADFGVKVSLFGEFKDPAEAAQVGSETLKKIISSAVPAPEFYFGKYLGNKTEDWSNRESLKKLKLVLGKIKNIASAVERNFWVKELAKKTGVAEKILSEEMDRIEAAKRETAAGSGNMPAEEAGKIGLKKYTRRELIGERLLRAAVAAENYGLLDDCSAELAVAHRSALNILTSGKKKSEDPRVDDMLSFIVLGAEALNSGEIDKLKKELKKEHVKDRRIELAMAVRRAEEKGDEIALRSALDEINSLSATA